MSVADAAAGHDKAVEATPPILSVDNGLATIRFNRPAVANRIEPADLVALSDHFERIDRDPAVRVLVMTGTGRIFSSGYHLGDLKDRASGQSDRRDLSFEDMV